MSDTVPVEAASAASDRSLYRAIWRWHFYAGLLTIPFMLLLAVTGTLYLFREDLNDTVFAYRTRVAARSAPDLPPSALLDRAAAVVPGSVPKAYREPASDTGSAVATVTAGGVDWLVFLNPADGRVLDRVPKTEEFNQVVRKLHSLEYLGTAPKLVIEAVGGFALVLVATGVFLWWPRGRAGGVLSVRGTPSRRVFWRDLHAVTGVVGAALVFFLAASGMLWTQVWGDWFNHFAARIGQGIPAEVWDDVPSSKVPVKEALGQVGWTAQNTPVAASMDTGTSIGVDRAYAIAREHRIGRGFELTVPQGVTGVYSAAFFPTSAPTREHMLHIDQYSGRPLVDVGFHDYGALGQVIEVGTDLHMGLLFGRLNQAVMLLAAVAVGISSVTAAVMWWKRRPRGRLGVPPYPADRRVYAALWVLAGVFGVAFPVTGLAIVAMLAFDLIVVRTIPPLRRAFA